MTFPPTGSVSSNSPIEAKILQLSVYCRALFYGLLVHDDLPYDAVHILKVHPMRLLCPRRAFLHHFDRKDIDRRPSIPGVSLIPNLYCKGLKLLLLILLSPIMS